MFAFVSLFSLGLALAQSYFARFRRWLFTGLGLFSLILIFSIVLALSFQKYSMAGSLDGGQLANYLKTTFTSLGYLVLITLSFFFYGNLLPQRFSSKSPLLKIALGLIFFVLLLFGISAIWLLNKYSIVALIILPFLISYKTTLKDLNNAMFKTADLKLSAVGTFIGSILVFYVVLNFVYVQAPFPIGFDSRNFYMNIANQVAHHNGLIYGFRPYNWALLISTGYVMFESSPVPLSISFFGYILSLFAMFHLGVKVLKLNPNIILFVMLLFTVSPAITNQLHLELKTDFGLLFFQLMTLSLFLKYISKKSTEDNTKILSFSFNSNWVLMGALVGFGLGIKMTNLFLLFALIICLFWIKSKSIATTLGVVSLTMALFILVRLDDLSGVRIYHLGLNYVVIACGLLGLILLIKGLIADRAAIVHSIKSVVVLGMMAGLVLLPWLVKNYNETKSLHPQVLLNGATMGPEINMQILHRNYMNSK